MIENSVNRAWNERWKQKPSFTPVNPEHDTISILTRKVLSELNGEGIVFLDVGSGPGSRTIPLAGENDGIKLVLVDQSNDAMRLAQENAANHQRMVNCLRADAFRLPFKDNAVGCVFSNGLNEHFLDPKRQDLFNEMVRVVKPGGLVAVITPNKLNPFHTLSKMVSQANGTWPFGPQYDFTPKELVERMQKAGITDIREYGVGFFTSWIRILSEDRQRQRRFHPTRSTKIDEFLWKLDSNITSGINRAMGREILVTGIKCELTS